MKKNLILKIATVAFAALSFSALSSSNLKTQAMMGIEPIIFNKISNNKLFKKQLKKVTVNDKLKIQAYLIAYGGTEDRIVKNLNRINTYENEKGDIYFYLTKYNESDAKFYDNYDAIESYNKKYPEFPLKGFNVDAAKLKQEIDKYNQMFPENPTTLEEESSIIINILYSDGTWLINDESLSINNYNKLHKTPFFTSSYEYSNPITRAEYEKDLRIKNGLLPNTKKLSEEQIKEKIKNHPIVFKMKNLEIGSDIINHLKLEAYSHIYGKDLTKQIPANIIDQIYVSPSDTDKNVLHFCLGNIPLGAYSVSLNKWL